MTNKKAAEILCREITCVNIRASGYCEGLCEGCILILDDEEVKEAMLKAVNILTENRSEQNERA